VLRCAYQFETLDPFGNVLESISKNRGK